MGLAAPGFVGIDVPIAGNVPALAIAYGNGRFVAAMQGGYTLVSPDGFNWNQPTPGTNAAFYDGTPILAYGNGQFLAMIAAGTNTLVQVSVDGIDWTQPLTLPSASMNALKYTGSLFIGVGADANGSGLLATSADGTNWSTEKFSSPLTDVASGGGTIVAVSAAGTEVYTTNGLTWQEKTVASSNILISVVYASNRFIVQTALPGYSPLTNTVFTSGDGVSWNAQGMTNGGEYRIVYGDGFFAGLRYDGCPNYAFSKDAIDDWPPPGPCPARAGGMGATCVAFGAGTFVLGYEYWDGSYNVSSAWFLVLSPTYGLAGDLLNSNSVNIAINGGGIGQRYRLQVASAFPTTNWVDLITFTNAGPTNFLDVLGTNSTPRLYRVAMP